MANQAPQQQFMIERIYVKDISFESPNSPAIFNKKVGTKINMNVNIKNNSLDNNRYEVELIVTVESKDESGKTFFIVEVTQAGIFVIKGYQNEQLNHLLGSFCPNTLFPYLREVVSNLVSKGGFPQLHIAPINFDALYKSRMENKNNGSNTTSMT